jgi:hypothetical protein
MRPVPLKFEDADGTEYVIDILTLGQVRELEAFVTDPDRRAGMNNLDQGMEILRIGMMDLYPDVDIKKIRLVGGATRLGELTQEIIRHAGMEPAEPGEPRPAQEKSGTTSTDS